MRRSADSSSTGERDFSFLHEGQPVIVAGVAGVITRFTPERWGDQIHVSVNGIELPYHIRDFIIGIIELVAPERNSEDDSMVF